MMDSLVPSYDFRLVPLQFIAAAQIRPTPDSVSDDHFGASNRHTPLVGSEERHEDKDGETAQDRE